MAEAITEPPARSATPGVVGDSFSGGFTPIHRPPQRYAGDTGIREPILYTGEESIAPTKYIPTTRDLLTALDRVKRDRETFQVFLSQF